MARMTGASLYDAVTLSASSAKTATGNSGNLILLPTASGIAFELDATAAATDAADTLDVFVQTRVAGNWVDVVHFTQVLGNGGAKNFLTKLVAAGGVSEFEDSIALPENDVRHILGDAWRARWAVVDSGDANQSFTFSVKAVCM